MTSILKKFRNLSLQAAPKMRLGNFSDDSGEKIAGFKIFRFLSEFSELRFVGRIKPWPHLGHPYHIDLAITQVLAPFP